MMTAGSLPMGITAADTEPVSESAEITEEASPGETTDQPEETQPGQEEEKEEAQDQTQTQDPAEAQPQEQDLAEESADPAAADNNETPDAPITAPETAEQEAPRAAGWYLEEDGWHNYHTVTENGESTVKERVSEWYVPTKKRTLKDGDVSLVLTAKTTYYFDEEGVLVTNRQVKTTAYKDEMDEGDRFFNSKGVPVTGYAKYGGKIHYIEKKKGLIKETMVNLSKAGTYTLYYKAGNTKNFNLAAGKRYFDADGCMVTGEYQTKDNGIQYFTSDGINKTGYQAIDGNIYFYNSKTGKAVNETKTRSKTSTVTDLVTGKSVKISAGTRYFTEDGRAFTGWYPSEEEKTSYYNAEGLQQTGYISVDGGVYYADADTGLYRETSHTLSKDQTIKDQVTGKSVKLAKGTRFFGPDGVMRTGWYPSEEEKNFYYGADGLLKTGHISVNGVIYFVYSKDGALRNASSTLAKDATITDQVTGKSVKLPKGTRYFGDDCAMVTGWYPSEEEKNIYYGQDGLQQTGYISVNGELFYIDGENGILKDAGNTLSKDLTIKDQVTGKSVTLSKGTRYFDENGDLVHGEYETRENGTQYFDTYGNAQYGYVYYDGNLHYIDREKGKLKNAVDNDIDGIREIVNQDQPSTYVTLNPGDRYFDENGNAVTGCYREIDAYRQDGKHYTGLQYFFEDGAMAYRFTKIDGNWKYFQKSGGMVKGGDFDFSNATGAISATAKGARSFDGGTYFKAGHYYFDENGNMQTGIIAVGDRNYAYSDTTGRRIDSGWVLADGVWYLLENDGTIAVDEEGNMISGTPSPEGFLIDTRDGKTYMVNDDGTLATGWHKVGEKWYHFNETTGALDKTATALTDQFVDIDGKVYYFNSKGKFVTGFRKINNKWYYFDKDGVRAEDTTVFGIKFNENGVAKTGGRSYTSYSNYTSYPVTDEMIDMVERAQKKLASTNPTHWYCFTDKDHHRMGVFQYKSGKWNLVIYTSVAVGAWVNGRSKTPTTICHITQKNYRMTHFTSFYYVSWTSAGVGYHTPLYDIGRHSVTENTPFVDSRTSGHISNGCMRIGFYNAYWVYNHVPRDTWVQMYGK